MRRGRWASVLLYAAVALFVLVTLAPVLWLLVMSLSYPADLTVKPLAIIPHRLDVSHYGRLLSLFPNSPGEAFLLALRNSLGASLGATLISLVILLYNPSTVVLSVGLMDVWGNGFYPELAVYSLLLMVLGLVPVVLLWKFARFGSE